MSLGVIKRLVLIILTIALSINQTSAVTIIGDNITTDGNIVSGNVEANLILAQLGFKDLSRINSAYRIKFALNLANTTLHENRRLALIEISYSEENSLDEEIETLDEKLAEINISGEKALLLVNSSEIVANETIMQAVSLAKLNAYTTEDIEFIDSEAYNASVILKQEITQHAIEVSDALNLSRENITINYNNTHVGVLSLKTLYFYDIASDIPEFRVMNTTPDIYSPYGIINYANYTSLLLYSAIYPEIGNSFTTMPSQTWDADTHITFIDQQGKNYTKLYISLYKRTSDGNETIISNSTYSDELIPDSNNMIEIIYQGRIKRDIHFNSTDRIVARLYIVDMKIGGTTNVGSPNSLILYNGEGHDSGIILTTVK